MAYNVFNVSSESVHYSFETCYISNEKAYIIILSSCLSLVHSIDTSLLGCNRKIPAPFSINLESNSIATENFIKIPLLESYITVNKFDIMCLSETFLDSSFLNDDPRLNLNGYSPIRADHPSDTKKGGLCIYYKNYLPLILKPALSALNECLVCELKVGKRKCFITILYRSPVNQLKNLIRLKMIENKLLLRNNPYIYIYIGDFNARNINWWEGNIDNYQGLDLDNIPCYHGLQQMINGPTHILPKSASCIYLLYTFLST